MPERTFKPEEFWIDLERRVAARTVEVLNTSDRMREPVIAYLREAEAMARAEGGRDGTIRVIASARRVLGDRSDILSADQPLPGLAAGLP